MRILLVEDDVEISKMLKTYLTAENFEVDCAVDGEMARIKPTESVRRMPDLWEPNHAFMLKTQKGIAYYFHTQGRPVKCSDYYEKKTTP